MSVKKITPFVCGVTVVFVLIICVLLIDIDKRDFTAFASEYVSCRDTLSQTFTPLLKTMPNRISNINRACEMINEKTLLPGEIFSFNRVVGERCEERGFKPAPTFLNGKVVDTVGGGICQVSSTLYYACLLANLEIVSRTNHSMSADYTKPGLDATASWDDIDYSFRNNTANPVKILAWMDKTGVYAVIEGTKIDNNTVEIEIDILSTTPYQTIYRDNPELEPGQTIITQEPHTGYVVQTYRVIKNENGEALSRKPEAKSSYSKLDEIIECGPFKVL